MGDFDKILTDYLLNDHPFDTSVQTGITLADMQAAIERLKPVMWYATTPHLERGKAYKISADADGERPECYVFNVDDFQEMRVKLAEQYILRNITEFRPDYRTITLRRLNRLYPPETMELFKHGTT